MSGIRSCAVCRTRAEKHQLLRFVRALDGEICFDEKGVLEQRGAFVCAKKICLEKAFKKKVLFRQERSLPTDFATMYDTVSGRLKKSLLAKLGLIRKQGRLEMGKDAALGYMRAQKAGVVILAKDFSLRSVKDVVLAVERIEEVSVVSGDFSMSELGQSLGREKTGVVALPKSRITDEIVEQIKKIKELAQ